MKDLLEKILSYLPVYIPDLVRIVSGPKRFVAERNKGSEGDLIKAFTFLGISMSIFFILQAPLAATGRDFFTDTASHGIQYLFFIVAFSAVLRLSWNIVGGKANYQRYLLTSCYYAGATSIGLAIAGLCFIGVLRVFYRESYALFVKAVTTVDPLGVSRAEPKVLRGIVVAFIVFLIVSVPTLVWGIIGWGAYREFDQLSRPRSGLALFLTILFSLPLVVAEFVIAFGLTAL